MRVRWSTFFCCSEYSGTPLREMNHTISAMKGSSATSSADSAASRVMVTMMPPIKRIGARMPMRCIMPVMRYTL